MTSGRAGDTETDSRAWEAPMGASASVQEPRLAPRTSPCAAADWPASSRGRRFASVQALHEAGRANRAPSVVRRLRPPHSNSIARDRRDAARWRTRTSGGRRRAAQPCEDAQARELNERGRTSVEYRTRQASAGGETGAATRSVERQCRCYRERERSAAAAETEDEVKRRLLLDLLGSAWAREQRRRAL